MPDGQQDVSARHDRRYQAIFESAVDLAIIGIDPGGWVTEWSRGAERILGWSADEMRGEPLDRIFAPEERSAGRASLEMREALETGHSGSEGWRLRKDGTRFWASGEMLPLLGEDGLHLGFIKTLRDRSAQKRAEEALQSSERTLNAVLDALPVGVVIADAEGRIVRDNEANRALWGVPPETTSWEAYGDWVAWHPETGERIKAHEWAMSRALLKGEVTRGELIECQRFGSLERRFYLNNAAPVRDEAGRIVAGVVVELDVTEARQAERALQESTARLRAVLESTTDSVFMLTPDWRFSFLNRRASDQIATGHELQGQVIWEAFPDAISSSVWAPMWQACQRCMTERLPTEVAQFHGPRGRTFTARAFPAEDGGIAVFFRDVTQQLAAAARLAESDAWFRAMADNIPQLAWMARPDGYIFWYNRRWFDYTGTTLADMEGWGWTTVHHPDHVERVVERLQHSWDTGDPWEDVFPLRGKGGTYRWFLSRAEPIRDAEGRVHLWFGTNTDVTEQRAAKAALDERSEGLALALEAGRMGVWSLDLASGRLDWDARQFDLFGWDPSLGFPSLAEAMEQVHPEDRPGLAAKLKAAAEAPDSAFSYEFRIVRPDGVVRWIGGYGRVVPGPDGPASRMAGCNFDVTERRETAEALAASNRAAQIAAERVQLALEAGAIIGTWMWDLPTDHFTADERFARSFGLDPAACQSGLHVDDVLASVHPDDRLRLMAAMEEAVGRGGHYSCEYRVRQHDGVFRWIEANGRVDLASDGTPLRFPGVLLDIDGRRAMQAERDRATALLRTFAEAVPGVAYAKDRDGRMLVANAGVAALIGKPPHAFLGKTDAEFLDDKEQAARVMANDRRILETGIAEQVEEDVSLPDGTPAVWLSTKAPFRNAEGEVIGLVGASVDITARKQAEAALRDSEEKYRTLFDNMAEEVHFWEVVRDEAGRIRTWRLVDANPPALRSWGKTLNQIRGRTVDEIFGAGATQHYLHIVETIMRDRVPLFHEDYVPHIGRYFRFASVPLADHFVTTGADITPQKEAEAALRESETRLRLAQRIGRTGSFDWDIASNRATCSEEFIALHGLPPGTETEDFATWLIRVHPEDRERVAAHTAAFGDDDPPLEQEFRIVRPDDGSVRWIAERREIFRDEHGRPVRVIGSQRDVTERRAAEAVLARDKAELERLVEARTRDLEETQARLAHAQRMEALGQLAGGIAHDFNNVLQAAQGGLALIARRPEDTEKVARLARLAHEAVERGSAITRRLLTFSRRGEIRAEPVDAEALLVGMRDILTHTLGAGIKVRVETQVGLPMLLADKGQLETVLVNLATNARDAMAGNGTLTLSAHVEPLAAGKDLGLRPALEAGAYVRLSVSDTGAGMTPEVLTRATEPFFTTKPTGQGTGLGLAMARGFAEQSDGGLFIRSTPGRGTTVSLWFPVATARVPRPRQANHDTAQAACGSPIILVVDDEDGVREALAVQLEDLGYHTVQASGGVAALALLDQGGRVDLMVCDLSMPGMDGVKVIQEAQRRRPRLPAILLTGYAGNAATLAVGGAVDGPFSLLSKPIAAPQLGERIAVLLAGTAR